MKKIPTDGKDGFLHLIGEFELVRKSYGGQLLHEPRWAINLHYTDGPKLPDDHIEDDRIEIWWTKIVVAQQGGILTIGDGVGQAGRQFHISTGLPLVEPIFIFEVMGDPTEITGHEDRE